MVSPRCLRDLRCCAVRQQEQVSINTLIRREAGDGGDEGPYHAESILVGKVAIALPTVVVVVVVRGRLGVVTGGVAMVIAGLSAGGKLFAAAVALEHDGEPWDGMGDSPRG